MSIDHLDRAVMERQQKYPSGILTEPRFLVGTGPIPTAEAESWVAQFQKEYAIRGYDWRVVVEPYYPDRVRVRVYRDIPVACEDCGAHLPAECPADGDCPECGMGVARQYPDYEPKGPCCAGVVTGGPSGCMCDLKEPYAKNH